MAMTKAEMESHQKQYHLLMDEAMAEEKASLYRVVIKKATASWEHIDGMMQYERRYEKKTFASLLAIDLTLKYAPLLLDFATLDKLELLLKNYPRIEKNTSEHLGQRVTDARTLMWVAYRLWDHLEQNPNSRQDELRQVIGGKKAQWGGIIEAWEKMGLSLPAKTN